MNKKVDNNNIAEKNDFIRTIIREDVANNKYETIHTRFPPEPNGFLHIGHAKAICTSFGIAAEFGGVCNLRFDDTNPIAEKQDYVDSIKEDVTWLGFQWHEEERYTSSYFEQLHKWAIQLIEKGKAYVDFQTLEEIRENRGSFTQVGTASPQREAGVDENLKHFADMTAGKYKEGEAVLRAKIDMLNPNMNMRDPVIYRIMHETHHQTGDTWCVYPMYDYAHPLSDAIENISHSLCTLEFEDHRPFYDWVIDALEITPRPHQYEFSRLNVDYTMTSKRKLKKLVDEKIVSGWDDPRMPTIAGMRRRGYTPEGLRDFCQRVGLSKADGIVDPRLLEFSIRQSLEDTTGRAMAVLKPLKVTITNFHEALSEWETLKSESVIARWDETDNTLWITQPNHPHKDMGEREIPFTEEIYIDQDDYVLEPPKGYKRLSPEKKEIRLRNTYCLSVDEHITDNNGNIVELKATIDPTTLGKNPEERKVKGVIHWVSVTKGVAATVRLYQQLFSDINPANVTNLQDAVNPQSMTVLNAILEPSLASAKAGARFQFERESYFIADSIEHTPTYPVFNQIVSLRDSFKPT